MDTPAIASHIDSPQLPLFGLQGRRVLVLGLGESGMAMARWAAFCGATVRVADTRDNPQRLAALRDALPDLDFVHGPFDPTWLDGCELLAWSPGLSIELGDSAAFHALARSRGVTVLGELDLFAQALASLRADGYAPRVVAITGTNGKTTTTRLVAHLCEQAGLSAIAAGNIAPAALDALREALAGRTLPQVWVLELSSFQLAVTQDLVPDASAILNLTQDHLDWHVDMSTYRAAKLRIYRGAAIRVCNRDDPLTRPDPEPALAAATGRGRSAPAVIQRPLWSFGLDAPTRPGEFGILHEGGLRWLAQAFADEEPGTGRRRRDVELPVTVRRLMPADALRIRGSHNHANALAALALASAIGVPMAAMLHGLRAFEGESHRCELVSVVNDVEYYDDSKGTNVGATVAALTGLGKRCLLIAGGDGKGQDFTPLADPVRRHARAVLLIGRDAPRLREALAATGVELVDCEDLPTAVREAARRAGTGDAVLLSPACASFDMFRNYAHRAEVFVAAVREVAEETGMPC